MITKEVSPVTSPEEQAIGYVPKDGTKATTPHKKGGKAIYQPNGKAAEYSMWACNLYNGCTHKCSYCYNNSGIAAKVLGGDIVSLKKSLIDEPTALNIFKTELAKYRTAIIGDGGLHFTFVSDPCLKQTIDLTWRCIDEAQKCDVKCQILTKAAWWLDYPAVQAQLSRTDLIRVGFTLTGVDSAEPGASTNEERIAAMKKLKDRGVTIWASIEPILDPDASLKMILETKSFCDFYKCGVNSLKKDYTRAQIREFKAKVDALNLDVTWKKSLLEFIQK